VSSPLRSLRRSLIHLSTVDLPTLIASAASNLCLRKLGNFLSQLWIKVPYHNATFVNGDYNIISNLVAKCSMPLQEAGKWGLGASAPHGVRRVLQGGKYVLAVCGGWLSSFVRRVISDLLRQHK